MKLRTTLLSLFLILTTSITNAGLLDSEIRLSDKVTLYPTEYAYKTQFGSAKDFIQIMEDVINEVSTEPDEAYCRLLESKFDLLATTAANLQYKYAQLNYAVLKSSIEKQIATKQTDCYQ